VSDEEKIEETEKEAVLTRKNEPENLNEAAKTNRS
jgi:hypothetical protein